MQLLRNHWSDVPEVDQATTREAYARAIRPRSVPARRMRTLTPAQSRLAAVAVASAVLLGAGFGVCSLLRSSQSSPASTQPGPVGLRAGPTAFGVSPFGQAGETITLDELK